MSRVIHPARRAPRLRFQPGVPDARSLRVGVVTHLLPTLSYSVLPYHLNVDRAA